MRRRHTSLLRPPLAGGEAERRQPAAARDPAPRQLSPPASCPKPSPLLVPGACGRRLTLGWEPGLRPAGMHGDGEKAAWQLGWDLGRGARWVVWGCQGKSPSGLALQTSLGAACRGCVSRLGMAACCRDQDAPALWLPPRTHSHPTPAPQWGRILPRRREPVAWVCAGASRPAPTFALLLPLGQGGEGDL